MKFKVNFHFVILSTISRLFYLYVYCFDIADNQVKHALPSVLLLLLLSFID